jgi:hypothetical protein
MAIQPGSYRTQGGRRAVVLCNDAPGYWPCVGYIIDKDGDLAHPRAWQSDGRSFASIEHENDLIVIKPSPTLVIFEHDEVEA